MLLDIYQLSVEVKDGIISLSQDSAFNENGKETIYLSPFQITHLVKILNVAKKEAVNQG